MSRKWTGKRKGGHIYVRTAPKKTALVIAKQNRRKISEMSEMHYIQNSRVILTSATVGLCYYVSGTPLGDDAEEDRTGNKVTSKWYRCRVWFNGDIASRRVRVIMFRDMNCQGAVPAVTDVLEAAQLESGYNWNNRARFSILSDKQISLPSQIADVEAYKHIQYKTTRSMKLEYISAAEAVTGAGKGAIFMLIISSVNGTADAIRYVYDMKFIP